MDSHDWIIDIHGWLCIYIIRGFICFGFPYSTRHLICFLAPVFIWIIITYHCHLLIVIIKQDSLVTTQCGLILLAEQSWHTVKPETGLGIYNYIHTKTVGLDIHVVISSCVFFFKLKPSYIESSTIQSDAGWATETSWNTRRIETGGTISHGWFKQVIVLRLCCKARLNKVVD